MKRIRHALAATALPIVLLASLSGEARAQSKPYLLDTGDSLEIDVFGMSDFKRRMTIDVDGDVSLPFVGEVHAAGLSVPELRLAVTSALAAAGAIDKPQVTVEIVEYRPFYISGDVSRPGAIPFRKGLTVRHAVALAGGYDALRFRTENPLMMAPELRSRHEALLLDLARAEAKIASTRAEIAGKPDFQLDPQSVPQGISGKVLDTILSTERQSLATRLQEWAKQTAFRRDRVAQARQQVATLEASVAQQSDASKYQAEAAERAAGNVARGVAGASRGDEERRYLALMKAQEADTRTHLSAANTELASATRELERLENEHRAELAKEVETLAIEREKIALDVRASAEKLVYAGAVKAQIGRAVEPDVVIHRGSETLQASASTEVMPGDLVEVTIDPQATAAAASSSAAAVATVR